MSSPPESQLRATQAAFAAALRPRRGVEQAASHVREIVGPSGSDAVARLEVYGNNTRYFFRVALERTYPVLRHRVGDEHFQQLAHDYRIDHPSTHGDLHWIGEFFPHWLANRTRGTEYAWLADLARLEWACESAWTAADAVPLPLSALGEIAPEHLASIVFTLQPSVRLVASDYPLWSVWQANQGTEAGPAINLATGAENCIVACGYDGVALYRVAAADMQLIEQLARGSSLGNAVTATDYPVTSLPRVLAWLFNEQLVSGIRLAA